jgi:hypothetical protein
MINLLIDQSRYQDEGWYEQIVLLVKQWMTGREALGAILTSTTKALNPNK